MAERITPGIVTYLAQQISAAAGREVSFVAEIDRGKLDLARESGATDCLDPNDAVATKAFMKASGGVAAASG